MNNKIALITGATSGIGTIIVDHLVKKGYSVIVLGRSQHKLDSLLKELNTVGTESKLHGVLCDLSSFDSVREALNTVRSITKTIDLMILNAGLWNFKFIETSDNIEETLQVNLLTPLLIFNELKPLLPRNNESKVIFTSSGLHQGRIEFENLEFRNNFSGFRAYRQSKLGLLLLTRWLSKQPEYSGINFFCVHPGMVNTNLGRNAGWMSRFIFKLFGKSTKAGAQTHFYLVNQDPNDLFSGEYYANSRATKTTSYSYQMDEAEKLWSAVLNYISN